MKKLILLLSIGIISMSYSKTIYVPADTSSIQGGISMSADGDTVLVAPGEYFENINFNGKSIYLSSYYILDQDTSYISSTIINGSEAQHSSKASVVTFTSGEDTNSVLNGFTITGGEGSFYPVWEGLVGGGIYILAGAKITNNYIINNSINRDIAEAHGGGIFKQSVGNTIIQNNLIADNSVSGSQWVFGGGIFIGGFGNTLISDNTIKNNSVEAVNPIDGPSGGGGLFIWESNPVIVRNIIIGNEAPFGGGIEGSGWFSTFNFRLINNTIAGNNASIKGGGIYLYNGHCTAINNIFWDNTAPADPDIFYRGSMNISYSITQGIFTGVGNLQVDPIFENDTYYLSDVSPAIDAGNPDEKFNDKENPENTGFPLWPAKGSLTADMGAFGGNDTVNVEIKDYLVQQNFLYEQFEDMHYRFAYPLDYDSTSLYPLTIVLHGAGGWGLDNEKQLAVGLPWRINAEYYGYNDFTIAPQSPTSFGWDDDNNLITVYNIIRNTIDTLPIDTTKIVITGFSRGGVGTWKLLSSYPLFFSAAVPISGNNRGGIGEIKHIPVWVNHGTADDNVRVSASRYYISFFENTGLTTVYTEDSSDIQIKDAINNNARLFYSEFEGAGHEIVHHTYDNYFLFEWLKKQTRPLIRPINSSVTKSFFKVNKDSVLFRTAFSNPYNFQGEYSLIVENFNKEKLRNISLYDDGLHGDSLSQDGIWGNYLSPFQIEDNYRLGIRVNNLDKEDEFYFHDLATFTTKGPLTVDHYVITSSDTIPNHGDRLSFDITLNNKGLTATASDITATMESLDTCAAVLSFYRTFGDIPPGENAEGNRPYTIQFSDACTDSMWVSFRVDIYSDDYLFWSDTFSVFVHKDPTSIAKTETEIPGEFALKQNFPNPFNPSTTIEFTLPKSEFVDLKVYNILGKEVSTLVSKKLNSGNHTYHFDGKNLASGLYYYQLVAGDYREVKKMILIR